ncbi:hypothetical protein JXA32_13340 [Candidatus Sumerlaeota bacterium]|nr:hypothetical protein [Candidatus Sumerlaeota bacterium]
MAQWQRFTGRSLTVAVLIENHDNNAERSDEASCRCHGDVIEYECRCAEYEYDKIFSTRHLRFFYPSILFLASCSADGMHFWLADGSFV